MKKYELLATDIDGQYRIRALVDIPVHGVKAGDLGGIANGEHNLSQKHNGWIDETSSVNQFAYVLDGLVESKSHLYDNVQLLNGTVSSSILEGSLRASGNLSILNSIIENGELDGDGNIVDSRLKNVTLKGSYVLNTATVLANDSLICHKKQIWSNVQLSVQSGKMERDLEIRDVKGTLNTFNIFEDAYIEYVLISNRNLNLTIGDSDIREGFSKIAGNSVEEPVTVFADYLYLLSSRIDGNTEINGHLKMIESVIQDFAKVHVLGMMENSAITEWAIVEAKGKGYTKLIDMKFAGDSTYTF